MSFYSMESGTETSRPREGIEITAGAMTWFLATGTRDATINGHRFRATPVQRGEVKLAVSHDGGDVIIELPVSHAIPQRYLAGGVPPRLVAVKVWRQQGTDAEVIWQGDVTSMACEGHVAKLRVPSRMGEALTRRVPTVGVSKACPHVLYDNNCRVSRDSFKVVAVVASVTGRVVILDVAMDDQWATFGELLHVTSLERMTIQDQTSYADLAGNHARIVMQAAIYELQAGDTVNVFAGCDHTVFACRSKFNNVVNYGGMPNLPTKNPFIPNGFGILQSE